MTGSNQRSHQRSHQRSDQRGVTLIEALIVVALIAMIAGLSYPSISSGLDTLRLRSTSDAIVSFLNIALDHADRRQRAVEVVISPHENLLLSRTADLGFARRLEIPSQIQIVAVLPALPAGIAAEVDPEAPRRFPLGAPRARAEARVARRGVRATRRWRTPVRRWPARTTRRPARGSTPT